VFRARSLGGKQHEESVENLHVFKLAHQLGAQELLGDQDVSNMTGMIFEPCDPTCYNAAPDPTD
jgi:hypothetical protein